LNLNILIKSDQVIRYKLN